MTSDGDEAAAPGPGRKRRRGFGDDLLAGFERPGEERAELRGFFASTLAASLFGWDLAFTLGAYHTVFYVRLFQLLVVSTVLLLGAVALRREIKVRLWMLVALCIPLLWLVFRLVAPELRRDSVYHAVDLTLIGLIVATFPLTIWALARILAPEYFALPSLRLKATAVAIVVVVSALGFVVGRINDQFLTCHDFTIAGNQTPANCAQTPAPRR